jgi:hypothetical protein
MDEMPFPSTIPSFSEHDCVLERLWGQPFGGINCRHNKTGKLNVANSNFLTQISKEITKMPTISQ